MQKVELSPFKMKVANLALCFVATGENSFLYELNCLVGPTHAAVMIEAARKAAEIVNEADPDGRHASAHDIMSVKEN